MALRVQWQSHQLKDESYQITEGENYGLKVTLRKKSVIGGPVAMTALIEALDLPQNGAN